MGGSGVIAWAAFSVTVVNTIIMIVGRVWERRDKLKAVQDDRIAKAEDRALSRMDVELNRCYTLEQLLRDVRADRDKAYAMARAWEHEAKVRQREGVNLVGWTAPTLPRMEDIPLEGFW